MVWRTPRKEFDPKCTIPMIKQGDGSVMIWGCFTRQSWKIVCIMDKFYSRDILEQNLQPSII